MFYGHFIQNLGEMKEPYVLEVPFVNISGYLYLLSSAMHSLSIIMVPVENKALA